MPGLKTIYGRDGVPLTDIRASVIRSSLLNDIGEAVFMVSTSSRKCKRDFLEIGNYIVIQHDTLPDWVGIIDMPRVWHNGYVEVHAYEVPFILQYRLTPLNAEITGTPGAKVKQLLAYANAMGDTLIVPGNISNAGISAAEYVKAGVYTHLKNLSKNNQMDWVCSPQIDTSGKLNVQLDWMEKAGVVTTLELAQGHNVIHGDTPLEESGEPVNYVEAVPDTRLNNKYTGIYSEPMPYGLRAIRKVYSGVKDNGLLALYARTHVEQNISPVASTPLTVVDTGNTFIQIGLGNVVKNRYTSVGFDADGLGVETLLRILGWRFNESAGTCELFTGAV